MQSGQAGRNDMLAPATPIIRAGAGRGDRSVSRKGAANDVRQSLASLDLGLQRRAALDQRKHRALLEVVASPLERLR